MPRPADRPLIKFEINDSDTIVKCSQGHDIFRLVVRIRLKGVMVTRHARCVTCGEEESIDA